VADLANAPPAFAQLHAWLVEHHFSVLEDVPGDRFNQYVVVGKGVVRIALRGDRGDWDLTASLDGGRTFWQIDQLEAYLDGHPWIGKASSAGHRAEFVRRRLGDLQERWEQSPDACTELYRMGDEWMSWRFGLPIPDGGFPGRKQC
jgi:hypothetical protein